MELCVRFKFLKYDLSLSLCKKDLNQLEMYSEICVCERNRTKSGICFKAIKKKVGERTLANVEPRVHFTIFLFLSMFDVFCNFFLKNGKLDFKNRVELLFNMYYKAVDM